MEQNRVRKVVIAGGGTAGWVTAAALSRMLGPLLDVTLVESDAIGTVGVGEATIPTQRTFHHLLRIDEQEFMRATQASFKLGIAFENWARQEDRYIHSFGQVGKSNWMGDFQHIWLRGREEGVASDLGDYCLELQMAEAGKFYKSDKLNTGYAYHLDASLYASYLRKLSESSGVRRVEGKIGEVVQDGESGFIEALVLESGERIEGDLFIDSTGFRGLLIEETLKTGYENWQHWLPTDSAQAIQTRAAGPALPYTRAMAHEAGWQWRIPLQTRVGNGLVYCSEYLSDDAAREKLLGNIEGEQLREPRVIKYQTGRRKKIWNKNCIAFGLSSGFVEPLESTSIHMIQVAVTRLIQSFPFNGMNEALIARYNDQFRKEFEHIRDFIILHYKLTERDDSPFWQRCRDMEIPDTLAERIALFREDAVAYKDGYDLFQIDSWLQVMLGQRLQPQGYHRMGQLMTKEQLTQALDGLKTNIANAVAKMPSHQDFLKSYCPVEG